MSSANSEMTGALGRLLVLQENYPNLKADAQFMRLQDELAGTENRIGVARQDYNSAVQQYNTYIRRFPAAVTARVTGAKERKYFQVTDPSARGVPGVDFSDVGAPPAAGTTPTTPATPAAPKP
jgi:LemA protein